MAAAPQDPRQRKNNVRLGLILASVAVAFAMGFVAKIVMLGG
ncbi:cytochrome oxidase small assembly protein [Aquariibacter albus]|nr:cytochrome oxidase small assembly protein [Aquariibacter albus]